MIDLKGLSPEKILKELFTAMVTNDYSDMHIRAKQKVIVEDQRRKKPITKQALSYDDAFDLANEIYNSDTATTRVRSGKDIDKDYEFRVKLNGEAIASSFRFRINITSITVRGVISPSISIRMMYKDVPKWDEMGYEQVIWDNFRPDKGIVLVTGPTGSGKTSMLAAGIGKILETMDDEKIVTLEDPIEYTFEDLQGDTNIIEQSAMGTNIHDFMTPMKSILRRKPTICVVGESRDVETIRACVYVAQTGHLVYTTLHTNGVPETLKRLLNEFPVSEQHSRLSDLVKCTKMIVSQQILPTTDGKAIAIREYLVITPTVEKELEKADITTITKVARELTDKYGQSMISHAKRIHEQGLITDKQLNGIAREFDEE